jgi:hypothetical protein
VAFSAMEAMASRSAALGKGVLPKDLGVVVGVVAVY